MTILNINDYLMEYKYNMAKNSRCLINQGYLHIRRTSDRNINDGNGLLESNAST